MGKRINVALVGAGFVGSIHARSYVGIPFAFGRSVVEPKLAIIVDSSESTAKAAAELFEVEKWTTRWESALELAEVDLVDICVPPSAHREIGVAALNAGKHVLCEKPLGRFRQDAAALAEAAAQAGLHTMVGYNYTWAPIVHYARQLIQDGTIGTLRHYRSTNLSDYASDENKSWNDWGTWRWSRSAAGYGALNDYGSHGIQMARTLAGEIQSAYGQCTTLVSERPYTTPQGTSLRRIDTDDHFAALLTFENGCTGVIEASRVATGGGGSSICVQGSMGTLKWDMTRMNELELYLRPMDRLRDGFTTIRIGPSHAIQSAFVKSAGAPSITNVGLTETVMIEIFNFLQSIVLNDPIPPTFADGLRVATVLDQIAHSSPTGMYMTEH